MKKWIYVLGLCFVFKSTVKAVQAPVDAQGHALATIDFVGAIPCSIDASTGTNAVICGSVNKQNLVYGIIASSITATNFLVFRDSNTANLTSSTATLVYAAGTGSNSSGAATTQFFKFPVPILFTNGIVVAASNAPVQGAWTILYRARNTVGE